MEIGVDIVKIDRLKDVDQHFINRVYTQEEINVYNSLSSDKKMIFLASRWAVKEAIFKTNNQKDYLSYGCVNDINGKPYIVNHPEIKVSISHDGDYVIAFVIIND